METHSIVIPVAESSQVGEVRRTAATLASGLGWDATAAGQVSIAATELANNVVQHAGGGTLVLRALAVGPGTGLEILCLDSGRGMRDVDRCLQDGYSTAGTAGTGLGAVRRLAHVFDVYSASTGTAVVVQMWSREAVTAEPAFEIGVVSAPMAGETECGDAWWACETGNRTVFAMADGLGHGPAAATASQEAIRVFRDRAGRSPAETISLVHNALGHTRGAAMAIAEVDADRGQVLYAGIGNVAASVLDADGGSHSMVSHNGTLGHNVSRVREFAYAWPAGALLLMHTDGLATQRQLDCYHGLFQHHPSLVAGVLYRDYQRGRDDVTVLAARVRPSRT